MTFIDYLGQPILYKCPHKEYAFGRWQITEICPDFRQK